MRLETFVTTVAAVLHKRSNWLTEAPAQCYSIYDSAFTIAQQVGYLYDRLCLDNSTFIEALNQCRACTATYLASGAATDSFPGLDQYAQYCAENGNPAATAAANSAQIASYASSAGYTASWCASYSLLYNSIASNCSSIQLATISTSGASNPSYSTLVYTETVPVSPAPPVSASTPAPTANTTPLAESSTHSHTAAIAGGVVGGVSGIAVVVILIWLILKRRRKTPAQDENHLAHEKAQLHSDDFKPDRKELEGTGASKNMLQKQPIELPANEVVHDQNRPNEMASNEPAGHEMETTENEMAVLDRLARAANSSTPK